MARLVQELTQARSHQLFETADGQAGYFTAQQALTAGYSRRLQHYHSASGTWQRAGHGVYRLRDYPTSDQEDLVRLSLWSRDQHGTPQAVVSFDTALRIYDLSDLAPDRLHFSVPISFRKTPPPGVVVHRTDLIPDDVRTRTAYCITTPLRTLLDVAGSSLSPEHLGAATQEALARGMVRQRALITRLGGLGPSARARLQAALDGT